MPPGTRTYREAAPATDQQIGLDTEEPPEGSQRSSDLVEGEVGVEMLPDRLAAGERQGPAAHDVTEFDVVYPPMTLPTDAQPAASPSERTITGRRVSVLAHRVLAVGGEHG